MGLKKTALSAARGMYAAVERTGMTRGVHTQLAQAASRAGLTARANLHTGDVLHVSLASTVGRSIWLRGRYDDALVGYLLEAVRPGDAFLDVGANVGYYTAMAARAVGPSGMVVAVEPAEEPLSLLSRSIAENRWHNVVLCSLAASSRTTVLRFHPERDSGLGRVTTDGETLVGAVALDLLLQPWLAGRELGALKLDVENHELEALAGLQQTFAHTPPRRVLTEAHQSAGEAYLRELFSFFTTRGYHAVDPVSRRPIGVADLGPALWNVGFQR